MKWNWNTLTLLSGEEALPLSQDQRTETASLWSWRQDGTSAVSLSTSSMRGLSSLPGGGGWDVTTACRRPWSGSPWAQASLHQLYSCESFRLRRSDELLSSLDLIYDIWHVMRICKSPRLVEQHKKQKHKDEFLTHKAHTASKRNALETCLSVRDSAPVFCCGAEVKRSPVSAGTNSGACVTAKSCIWCRFGVKSILLQYCSHPLSPGYTCRHPVMPKCLCNMKLYTNRNMLNWEINQSRCLSAALGHVTIKKNKT